MNKIPCVVKSIQKQDKIALVKLSNGSNIFSVLMIDYDARIQENMNVEILFKESEVMVCAKECELISARNRFVGEIKDIEVDEIFARISFIFEEFSIKSLITKEAKEALGLEVGSEFAWFVKSNEISISF